MLDLETVRSPTKGIERGPRWVVDANGCWIWQRRRTRGGYGVAKLNGRHAMAHRMTYELAFGPIPPGLQVCHRCDNPPCVNPAHLFLGTAAENIRDRDAKCRTACGPRNGMHTRPETRRVGERNGSAKVTASDVEEIRRLRAEGVSPSEIGGRFGLQRWQVWMIATGRSWR